MSVQEIGGGNPPAAPTVRSQARPSTPAPARQNAVPNEAGPGQLNRVEDLRQQPPQPANPGQSQPVLARQGDAAAASRGQTLTNPDEILAYERSRPGVKEAYARLTPDQRKQFDQLARAQLKEGTTVNTAPPLGMAGVLGMAGAGPCDPNAPQSASGQRIMRGNAARQGLYTGLTNGRLLQTDSRGQTTLQNLHSMATQRFASDVDGAAVLSHTMAQAGGGMFGSPQSAKGTGATAALAGEMANQHPAEFVRQAAELTSPAGETRVGESTVRRDRSAGGDNMNDIYQSSTRGVARQELLRSEMGRNPQAAQAYAALSPQDRAKADRLLNATVSDSPTTPPPADFGSPESQTWMREQGLQARQMGTRQDLYALLGNGDMGARDSKGVTLLDNLDHLQGRPLAEGLDRRQVMGEVVHQAAHPETIHQGNRATCTVTTIEHMLAKSQPSEYARLMSGLASPEGRVQLRNGSTLERDGGVIPEDHSGRSQMSRVFQASMMEYGNGAKTYDNATDSHSLDGRQIKNRHGRTVSGLNGSEWERVADGTLGPSEDKRALANPFTMSHIHASLRRGQDVPVGLDWGRDQDGDRTGHALSVTRMDERYVYLRNPWGNNEMGNTDPNKGPIREALTPQGYGAGFPGMAGAFGGFGAPAPPPANGQNAPSGQAGDIRMTREEFQKHLRHYYVVN